MACVCVEVIASLTRYTSDLEIINYPHADITMHYYDSFLFPFLFCYTSPHDG